MNLSRLNHSMDSPLDVRIVGNSAADGFVVSEITFETSLSQRRAAYLVRPNGNGPFPVILYVHWYEPHACDSNRTQFVDEAKQMASKGVMSLLIETMWSDREWFLKRTQADDYEASIQQAIELRRSMDLLLAHGTKVEEASTERALENVRRLVQRNRQYSGIERSSAQPRPVRSVGIIGAGMMGSAVAAIHVKRNLPVVITDADPWVLGGAEDRIAEELTHKMPGDEARQLVQRLVHPTTTEAVFAQCDLVIESILEAVPAKRKLYARFEPHLSDRAILASNTSTIPIGKLAEGLADPDRFCGLHFFHPVRRRPLLEIVCGGQTGDIAIATAVAHAKAIDKMPIVIDDGPGFLVNRLLIPYLAEAMELLLEGGAIEEIEKAAKDFGMAKGPLQLLDEIGLDTTLRAGWVLAEAFPERIASSPLLVAMIKAGRLGRKAGAGFFLYDDRSVDSAHGRRDEAVDQIIARWAGPPQPHSADSIVLRLLLPMVLEATRLLEEGKVRDPQDIDLGAVFGLGFPAYKGGLLWWADTLGAAPVVEMLRLLEHLGPRTQPTTLLKKMAQTGSRFYDRT